MQRAIALILALSMLAGCAQKSIVGTWTTEVDSQPFSGTAEPTFRSDGTYRSKARLSAPNGVVIIASDMGKWKLDKRGDQETVTVTITDITFNLEGGVPERLDAAKGAMEASKPAIMKQANDSSKDMALEWKNADEFTMTANGKASVYKRKKS